MPDDGIPPFHLVSSMSGKHVGPFSAYTDALLARHIAGPEFARAEVMDNTAFEKHLAVKR